jgi:hypothetical protein
MFQDLRFFPDHLVADVRESVYALVTDWESRKSTIHDEQLIEQTESRLGALCCAVDLADEEAG